MELWRRAGYFLCMIKYFLLASTLGILLSVLYAAAADADAGVDAGLIAGADAGVDAGLPIADAGTKEEIEKGLKAGKDGLPRSVEKDLETQFSSLGFGPALFFNFYTKHRVFEKKEDAQTDLGSVSNFTPGLIVHYGWDFRVKAVLKPDDPNNLAKPWKVIGTRGFAASPFIGLFDFEKGINGGAFGLLGSYWRGDERGENRRSLNMGIGLTVQRDVLAEKRDAADSTVKKRDVFGIAIVLSTTLGL